MICYLLSITHSIIQHNKIHGISSIYNISSDDKTLVYNDINDVMTNTVKPV